MLAHGTLSPPVATETPLSLWPQLQTQSHPRLGHQDRLPLRSPGGPFFQCSRDPISIQPFSGQIFSSMTRSLPGSYNEFSFLKPMSNVDSYAGKSASTLPSAQFLWDKSMSLLLFPPSPPAQSLVLIAPTKSLTHATFPPAFPNPNLDLLNELTNC